MHRLYTSVVTIVYVGLCAGIAELTSDGHANPQIAPESLSTLREEKHTPLGLYLSSEEAFELLNLSPETLFIDVRDPVEISIMGHPRGIDAIVPFKVYSDQFDESIGEYTLVENPEFLSEMDSILAAFGKSKTDEIVVTCGSGWRSAAAVRKLAEDGYTNAWHVVDGYEGEEKIGSNSDNAWQLAGLPWTTTETVPGSAWRKLFCRDQTNPGSC